jgi:histidyl-tRNA synthetase
LPPLACAHEKCQEIKRNVPHPMNYLSEPFTFILKKSWSILEMAQLPYTINHCIWFNIMILLPYRFRIYAEEEGKKEPTLVASGARWTNLAKKMGFKKDIPGVTAVISSEKSPEPKVKRIPKPQFYFIQMGQEAKLRSLTLIETLRQAHIPVYHSLVKDKLTAQLMSAEHLKVPFILIMGQKESMENTVLVREMHNRSQETIRVDVIADYLKRLIQ